MKRLLSISRSFSADVSTMSVSPISAPKYSSEDRSITSVLSGGGHFLIHHELGMHCGGFDTSYCCILPPFNSVLAQIVKTARETIGPEKELMVNAGGSDAFWPHADVIGGSRWPGTRGGPKQLV